MSFQQLFNVLINVIFLVIYIQLLITAVQPLVAYIKLMIKPVKPLSPEEIRSRIRELREKLRTTYMSETEVSKD